MFQRVFPATVNTEWPSPAFSWFIWWLILKSIDLWIHICIVNIYSYLWWLILKLAFSHRMVARSDRLRTICSVTQHATSGTTTFYNYWLVATRLSNRLVLHIKALCFKNTKNAFTQIRDWLIFHLIYKMIGYLKEEAPQAIIFHPHVFLPACRLFHAVHTILFTETRRGTI